MAFPLAYDWQIQAGMRRLVTLELFGPPSAGFRRPVGAHSHRRPHDHEKHLEAAPAWIDVQPTSHGGGSWAVF